MLNGYANPESTKKGHSRVPDIHYAQLGRTHFHISEIGFGAYRVDNRIDAHKDALKKALTAGVNLIDTSSNYTDGHSESLIGDVLTECVDAELVSRDEVVIVTKAGYLQGQNYEMSQKRKEEGKPYPELVECGKGLEHCIHPEFLEEQITNSLQRLNVERIDVLLLHNPEYYLDWAEQQQLPITESQDVFYDRIEQALAYLETEVERGRISYYGISSNTFGYPDNNRQFTELERIMDSLPEKNHFAVIQLPLNLYETGAITTYNQSSGLTVLDLAKEYNLGVLINRPLNAFDDGKLYRLSDFELNEPVDLNLIHETLNHLIQVEQEWKNLMLENNGFSEEQLKEIQAFFTIGAQLRSTWTEFSNYVHWKEALSLYILPRIEYGVGQLTQVSDLNQNQNEWLQAYLTLINSLTKMISDYYKEFSSGQMESLKVALQKSHPMFESMMHLSQMSVNALRQVPAVSAVLVGMRQESYVSDMLGALTEPVQKQGSKPPWI